jgi:hypothetical protein
MLGTTENPSTRMTFCVDVSLHRVVLRRYELHSVDNSFSQSARPRTRPSDSAPLNQFPLQTRSRFGTFDSVRMVLPLFGLLALLSNAHGQDQESKLVDRLLKPNTSLQSTEQNKKFKFAKAVASKPANVGTFYVNQKPSVKTFSATRDFSSSKFSSRSFNNGLDKDPLSAGRTDSKSQRTYVTWRASAAGVPHDADKTDQARGFAGTSPFLEKGKSQKSFDHKNPPMTIEQVRELLNKNK